MPTAYTERVENGQITELKDYALLCARSMGFMLHMRDDPLDAPLRPWDLESTFIKDQLTKAQKRLEEYKTRTDDDWKIAADKDYEYKKQSGERLLANDRKIYDRYASMLSKVKQWKVPEKLEELKEFMIQQIELCMTNPDETTGSIMRDIYWPKRKSWTEFKAYSINKALEDIDYYAGNIEKERRRKIEADSYLEALKASL